MAIPRSTLITGVTNDPFYNGEDKIPSSLALSERLSARALEGALLNLDNLTDSGCYSYSSNASNLPEHMLGTTGLVFVFRDAPTITDGVFGTSDTTVSTASIIRQIVWPSDSGVPYTRIKDASSSNTWTDWNSITGTNPIVIIDKDTTAVPGTTYYGYGSFALTLPPLSETPIGTTIYLNQYAGSTMVYDATSGYGLNHPAMTASTKNVWTDDVDVRGTGIAHVISPQYYIIKVVENNTVTGGKKWISYAKNAVNQSIMNHEKRFDTKGKATKVLGLGLADIGPNTEVTDVFGNSVTLGELIETTNPIITLTVPVSGSQVFTLPTASTELDGSEVTLILPIPNQSVIVKTADETIVEEFTNDYVNDVSGFETQGLVLKFVCIDNPTAGVNASRWVLIGYNE